MEQYLKKMAVIDRNKNSITLSNGSIIEIPFEIEDDVSIEELNKILKEYLDKLNIFLDLNHSPQRQWHFL